MPAATVATVKNRPVVYLVLLALIIAPAMPVLASLCEMHGCEMMSEHGGCSHMAPVETASEDDHGMEGMDCCPSTETSVSSATTISDECCPTLEATSTETPARLQGASLSLEAPELSNSLHEASTPKVEPIARALRPLPPPPELFTLHSAFLI